jgi:hypothetical protein
VGQGGALSMKTGGNKMKNSFSNSCSLAKNLETWKIRFYILHTTHVA